jgi:hypothetical protein
MKLEERTALKRGDEVLLQLDSGDSVEAAILSLRRPGPAGKTIVRKRHWSRWKGTPTGVTQIARQAAVLIREKTGEEPQARVDLVHRNKEDEEHYFELDRFETDFELAERGSADIGLRDVEQILLVLGPTDTGRMTVTIALAREVPAMNLFVEGANATDASGIRDELSRTISKGRLRPPAPNQMVGFLLFGVIGILYGYFFFALNLEFLPDNFLGDFTVALLYLLGVGGLIFGLRALLEYALPPLELVGASEAPRLHNWKRKVAVIGAVLGALAPWVLFALDRLLPEK